MSDKPYRTPKACYTKAPVRRETPLERRLRHYDQVPARVWIWTRFIDKGSMKVTYNKDLVPGKPLYYKEVTG